MYSESVKIPSLQIILTLDSLNGDAAGDDGISLHNTWELTDMINTAVLLVLDHRYADDPWLYDNCYTYIEQWFEAEQDWDEYDENLLQGVSEKIHTLAGVLHGLCDDVRTVFGAIYNYMCKYGDFSEDDVIEVINDLGDIVQKVYLNDETEVILRIDF